MTNPVQICEVCLDFPAQVEYKGRLVCWDCEPDLPTWLVTREAAPTVMPAEQFDRLVASLDEPDDAPTLARKAAARTGPNPASPPGEPATRTGAAPPTAPIPTSLPVPPSPTDRGPRNGHSSTT